MLVVIRCPKCRAASRVDEPDLGQTVQCPKCADTFTAIEEAELIAAGPKSPTAAETANDTATPPRSRRPRRPVNDPLDESPPSQPEPTAEAKAAPATTLNPDFDPFEEHPGSLPASVLIGLALLPFLIPILWLIAPVVLGQEPMLSLGSALALAVSASVLCLAVIYTVDWRPSTRIRGVLLLVVLSYVAGIALYFMKKEWVDGVRKFFGVQLPWVEWRPPAGGYRVLLPTQPIGVKGQQPLGLLIPLSCHQAHHSDRFGGVTFVVGSSSPRPPLRPGDPPLGSDAWFKIATDAIATQAQAQGRVPPEEVKYDDTFPGRQLDITLPDGQTRLVRLFVVKERVYYLAAEGPGITLTSPEIDRFFSSFEVPEAAK